MDEGAEARRRIAEIEEKQKAEADDEMVSYYDLVLKQWRAYLARVESNGRDADAGTAQSPAIDRK